jgi:nucleoside-diphosphate-sugar epimerase
MALWTSFALGGLHLSPPVLWMSPTDTPHVIRRMVQDVLSAGTIIRHYVLISSDSVFMASDRTTIRAKQGPGGLREGDAIEPIDSIAVKSARRRNRYQFSYGGNKAQAERTLQGQGAAFPRWTVLRFPDVVGPFDNLGMPLEPPSLTQTGSMAT